MLCISNKYGAIHRESKNKNNGQSINIKQKSQKQTAPAKTISPQSKIVFQRQ